ncbi:hypothetical protein [Christiangramia sp.]|uniref:hypothetical protein n=1 Tax=Christiangramia sp. TaxID=1931228 RepID=UPI002615B481|nr:hypothetical protein [Christiangramia sp.]
MNLGSANSAEIKEKSSRYGNKNSLESNSDSGFQRILQKGRLTEEDLERFQANILKAHKKKHYKVLVISALIFLSLGVLFLFIKL